MGFKDLFVKNNKQEEQEAPKKAVSKQPQTLRPAAVTVTHPAAHAPVEGGTDFTKYFDDVLLAANTPEPDYYEFAQAVAKKQGQGLTEQQIFTFSYDAFSTMGVTPQKLITSAEKFIGALDTERHAFEKELKGARDVQVDAKQKRILSNEEEIKRLQEENMKLNNEVSASMQKLAANENNFTFAFNNRRGLITEHITKIEQYLNNANS